jgi:hypothetical protein
MRMTDASRGVLIIAGAVIAIASSVAVANAQSGRHAAVQRCMAQARASVDVNLGAMETRRRETAIYRSCMQRAGFRP